MVLRQKLPGGLVLLCQELLQGPLLLLQKLRHGSVLPPLPLLLLLPPAPGEDGGGGPWAGLPASWRCRPLTYRNPQTASRTNMKR